MFRTRIESKVQISSCPINPSSSDGLRSACAKLIESCQASNIIRSPDSQYLQGIYVTSGGNLNGDFFLPSELAKGFHSCLMKPIDIEHAVSEKQSLIEAIRASKNVSLSYGFGLGTNTIIGAIYDAALVDAVTGETTFAKDFESTLATNYEKTLAQDEAVLSNPLSTDVRYDVIIAGILWDFLFPKTVAQVVHEIKTGNMALSMEVFFTDYDWVVGDKKFSRTEAPHLLESFNKGQKVNGNTIYRVLRNITFGGVGAVSSPGNQNAFDFVEVASNKNYASAKASLVSKTSLDVDASIKQDKPGGLNMDPNQIVEAVTNVRDIEALKHECASLKNIVETLKSELAAKDTALVTATTEAVELAKTKATLEVALETTKAELDIVSKNAEVLVKDLETAKTEASELASKLGTHELADRIAARLDTLKTKDLLVDEAVDATAVAALTNEAFDSFVADRERVVASVKARVTTEAPSIDPIANAEKQVLEVMSATASARPTEQSQVSPYTRF